MDPVQEYLVVPPYYRPLRSEDPEDLIPKDGKLTVPEEESQDQDLRRRVEGWRSRLPKRQREEEEQLLYKLDSSYPDTPRAPKVLQRVRQLDLTTQQKNLVDRFIKK